MRLISPAYVKEQKSLHATISSYGSHGFQWAYLIAGIAAIEGCHTILDYGSGKGTLGDNLRRAGFVCRDYDPAGPHPGPPERADFVVAVDVLEHVEPDCLDDVLIHVSMVARQLVFVNIPTVVSQEFLSDGRNAHLNIHPFGWWRDAFEKRGFKVRRTWPDPDSWTALMNPPGYR